MKKPLILSLLVIGLCILPFFIAHGGAYSGSDDQAESAIQQLNPDYKPWAKPLFEPASSEIESLLFTLQGCIGTAIIFYILGYYRGKRSAAAVSSAQAAQRSAAPANGSDSDSDQADAAQASVDPQASHAHH